MENDLDVHVLRANRVDVVLDIAQGARLLLGVVVVDVIDDLLLGVTRGGSRTGHS